MSDKQITDAYLRGERERLEKWLDEEPAASKPAGPKKPTDAAASNKDDRSMLNPMNWPQAAADFIYPVNVAPKAQIEPGAEGLSMGQAASTVGREITEKVVERQAEGVAQVGTALAGKSQPVSFGGKPEAMRGQEPETAEQKAAAEPAFQSKWLGTIRDLTMGSLNTVMPFSAAGGHVMGEIFDFNNVYNGQLSDEVLTAKLQYARLHKGEDAFETQLLKEWLAIPYEQRIARARGAAEITGEVGSSLIGGYTGVARAVGGAAKTGAKVAQGAEAAARVAGREAVGAKAVEAAKAAPVEAPPVVSPAATPTGVGGARMTAEEFVAKIGEPGAETLLEKGKRALQSPEVQDWAETIWQTIRGERGSIGKPPADIQKLVEEAGGIFKGTTPGEEPFHWFDSPRTGSTLGGTMAELKDTATIKKMIAESDLEFAANDIVRATKEEGGASYNVATGEFAKTDSGFAVSIAPERGLMVRGELTPAEIKKFATDNADLLADQRAHIGTWRDADGVTHVDISIIVPDQAEAMALGRLYKQKAIFDFSTMSDLPVTAAPAGMHGAKAGEQAALNADELRLANEYDAALHDPASKPAWDELMTETEKLYDDITKKLQVEVVHGTQPYATIDEMLADMKAGHLKVSDVGIEHPFWTPEQNLKFRVVHDYLGHSKGNDFSLKGEYQAFLSQAEHVLSPKAKQALQTEVYGQAASFYKNQAFGEQKAFLSKENLNLPPAEQRLAGAQGASIENALAPRGAADTAAAEMGGSKAMTMAQGAEALEQVRKNEKLLAEMANMLSQLKEAPTPTFLDTLKNIFLDQRGAIGAKLPVTKDALKLAKKGHGGTSWYVGVPEELEKHFDGDWQVMADLIAVNSPIVRTETSVVNAIDAYSKWKKGIDPKTIGAEVPTVNAFTKTATEAILSGVPLDQAIKSRLKVWNFAQALKGDRKAVVVDRWMWKVFYPEEAARSAAKGVEYSGTEARYKLIEDWMRNTAGKMGVEPADLQAMIWVGKKIEEGDMGGIRPLREMIAETVAGKRVEGEAFDFFENIGKDLGQEGKINLGTALVLGRAAAGAAIGSMTGDDSESMARNALIGLGIALVPAGKVARVIGETFGNPKMKYAWDELKTVLRDERGAINPGPKKGFADFTKPPEAPAAPAQKLTTAERNAMVDSFDQKLAYVRTRPSVYDATKEPELLAALKSSRFQSISDVLKLEEIKAADAAATLTEAKGMYSFVLEDLMRDVAHAKLSGDPAMAAQVAQKFAFAGKVGEKVGNIEAAVQKGLGAVGSPAKFDALKFGKMVEEAQAGTKAFLNDSQVVEMLAREADKAASAKLAETASRYPQALWNIYYGLNLLSSPLTQVKNVLGDMAGLGLAVADRAMGELVALPFHAVGRGKGHVAPGETYELVRGIWEHVFDSMRAGKRTFQTGESLFGDVTKAGERLKMLASKNVDATTPGGMVAKFTDLMSTAAQKNLKFMDGTDEMFKVLSFNGEIRAQARRLAREQGYRGKELADEITKLIDRPTTAMLENAHYYAHENTFTKAFDPNSWGGALEAASKFPLARLTVSPFFRTPMRLQEFSLTHTPILNAFAKQTWSDIAQGGAKADLAIGKFVTGSMIAGSTVWLAAHGYVTGDWPKDPVLKATYDRAGWQPRSLYNPITNTYHSYVGIAPLEFMLSGAANYADAMHHVDSYTLNNMATAMGISYARGIADNPYLQSASDLSDVFEGWTRGESSKEAMKWLERRALSLVPLSALGRQVAKSVDPERRETKLVTEAPPEQREMNEYWAEVMKTVPGWSSSRPAVINIVTGESMKNEGGLLGLILPYQISTNKNDYVLNNIIALHGAGLPKEMVRVIGGNMPRDSVILKEADIKEGVLLSDNERTELTKYVTRDKDDEGRTLYQALEHLMRNDPEYQDASGGQFGGKAALVRDKWREFYNAGLEKFLTKHPEVANILQNRQLERDLNRLPSSMEDMKDPMRQMLDSVQPTRQD